jgi:hypothetical protein
MPANISASELTLLQYLQDHSNVSGGRIALDPKHIKRGLRVSMERLAEDSAALATYGFAGVRHVRRDDDDDASPRTCSAIWVTSQGEKHLRSRSRSGTAGRTCDASA